HQSGGVDNQAQSARHRGLRWLPPAGPARRKGDGGAAAAFEAGPVPGRKRGRLVEKEQLGIAAAPDRAMAPLESRHATDPLAGNPAPRAERAIVAMQPAAAIAHEQSAGDNGDELAERSNAVLQRHLLNRPRERDYSVS